MTFHIRKSTSLLAAVSAVVLFAAQGSESWAQTASDVVCVQCVDSSDIAPNAITTGKITNGAVNKNKILNGAVKSRHIAPNQVTGGKILDGSVSSADITDNSVSGIDILNESITQSDLQTNSVNVSEIVSGAVRSDEVLNNSLLGIDIQDNTITSVDVQNNSLSGIDILDNSITTSDITNNSLTNADIQDNSVFDVDLADEAGADFLGGNQAVTLTATDVTVRLVGVTAPTSGRVIVNASGTFQFGSAGVDWARCSITTLTTLDGNQFIEGRDQGNDVIFMPFAATRGFNVGSGTTNFRLVCDEAAGVTFLLDSHLTAIFVPTAY